MIPQRLRRLLGAAILALAPSVALAQSSLQQPNLVASPGVTVDTLPAAITKLYQNDLFLQNLVSGRFNTLGAAAYLNVGTVTGTVADGGALSAESVRAQGAEQANATAIQTNATAIATETSRAQGVEALKAPIASPAFTGVPTVPTAAAGTANTQAASTAFVANAVAAGGGGGSGGVPPSRQILSGGLATGGGDLTADRTITVPKAAQSDVAAGTDDAKALTSYSVAARLGSLAPLASPALVGTPTAPTAAAGTNSTQIATTGFLANALGAPFDLLSAETTVASAATTDIGAAATRKVAISGTTTITSLGTQPNRERLLRFTGALTLTQNSTSLVLPTGQNIVTAVGDTAVATSDASGNWRVRGYFRADGTPLAIGPGGPASGYQKLPGGLILQWGTAYNQTQSDYGVGFPIAFPSTLIGVWTTPLVDPGSSLFVGHIASTSLTSFTLKSRGQSGGTTSYAAGLVYYWWALGY